jgi:hypothetical protein
MLQLEVQKQVYRSMCFVAKVIDVVERGRTSNYESRKGEQEEEEQLHVEDCVLLTAEVKLIVDLCNEGQGSSLESDCGGDEREGSESDI